MSDKMQIIIDVESGKAVTKIKNLKDALGGVEKKSKKAASATDKLSTAIGGLAIGATAMAAAFKLVDVARNFDVINASLITVTGSAEAADKAFSQIQTFAQTTPFALEQVANAFIKMKALGLDPSEAALTSYGNTASAMGKDLNQMIEAVADAATGEFERLKEFGIKSSSQGDKVSFTFKGITTTVGKNSKEIEGYLQNIGNTDFAGAMATRAATLDGALSNLADSWDNLFLTISKSGVGDEINKIARAATGAIEDIGFFIDVISGNNEQMSLAMDIADTTKALNALKAEQKDLNSQDNTGFWGAKNRERLLVLQQEISLAELKIRNLSKARNELVKGDSVTTTTNDTGGGDTGKKDKPKTLTKEQELEARRTALAINAAQERFDALSLIAQTAGDDEETKAIDAFQQKIDRMEVEKEFLIQHGADRVELERQIDENRLLLAADLEGKITAIRRNEANKQIEIEKRAHDARYSITASGLGAVAGLVEGRGKKAFEFAKALRAGEILLSTIASSQKAYESQLAIPTPDAPLRAAAAATIAGIQGAARLAALNSTSFGGGGSVPSSSGGGSVGGASSSSPSYVQNATQNTSPKAMNINLKIEGLTGNESPDVLQRITDLLAPAISEQVAAGGNNVAVV